MTLPLASETIGGGEPPARTGRAAFDRRFAEGGETLRRTLASLYGSQPNFSDWWDRLVAQAGAAAERRSEDLILLDLAREADPKWILRPEMLGYSAYVERFAGSLNGLHERIPYLKRLGVGFLHLLPFWKRRAGDSDGGFAVSDYENVDPAVGDIADLDFLTSAMRTNGISLCVDLVLNHTSDDHPWAVAARNGDVRSQGFYHLIADQSEVDAYERHLNQVFPETAPGNFTYCKELGAWVWTTFYNYQWDLNWSNPEVFLEMTGLVLNLANRGVEGFRLDSAAYLWKRRGGLCRNEPEVHQVLAALRSIVSMAAPSVWLMSEVIAPVEEAASFLGTNDFPEAHLTYHSALMTASWAALAEGNASLVEAVIAATPPVPSTATWVTYVRCHDDIGWMVLEPQAGPTPEEARARLRAVADFYSGRNGGTFARGASFQDSGEGAPHGLNGAAASLVGLEAAGDPKAADLAVLRLLLLYGVAFAAGGMPMIYMGDEYAQLNNYAYLADPDRAHEGRWLHRPAFDELRAALAAEPGSVPARIWNGLQTLRAARAALPLESALAPPRLWLCQIGSVLALRRGDAVLALFNFSEADRTVSLPPSPKGLWRDLISDASHTKEIMLGACGMAWLKAEEP